MVVEGCCGIVSSLREVRSSESARRRRFLDVADFRSLIENILEKGACIICKDSCT